MLNFTVKCLTAIWIIGCVLSSSTSVARQERKTTQYVNCDYGYVVRIPHGLIGKVPLYQNHGFYIELSDEESRIDVFNSYNMSDSSVSSTVFSYELEFRKGERKDWRIVNQRLTREHDLDSTRVTASYTRDGTAWKSEILIMYRPKQADGLGDIVYVVELSGPAARYDEAIPYFNQTVEGFHLTELPRGACPNK